ncbi:DEAD/DEAH box helicase [Novosphingobium sp.]|uniref:DEAD/DEAH box helicase n=1 Tax=Novosphingobium sp. TaxID=1874826 RepID=UPI00333EE1DC
MKFADLGLSDQLLQSVLDAGYDEPTPIQAQAIPSVLMMRDIIGIAQTGTGKTAGFVLPMIDILAHGRRRALMPRSLILEPTRELAAQVAENFEKYGKNHDLKMALLIGGVQMGDQVKALSDGVDVLIATPGRLMDLFERGKILLTGCELLVIDEADRMLDMGFIPDIETICAKLPTTRQTLLFSATMPPPIKKLADRFLSNPKYIEVARPASANINIAQYKLRVPARNKRDALREILQADDVTNAIIFANRKTTVRDLATTLKRAGFAAGEIHGDMDQPARNAELQRFKDGVITILCASDVAARGLDIKGVSHVINFDTPWHPDDYIHRIGRTGRGGASGRAYTLVSDEDLEAIGNVEKLTGMTIPEMTLPSSAARGAQPATVDDSARPVRDDAAASDQPAGERRGRRRSRDRAKPQDAQTARAETAPESAPESAPATAPEPGAKPKRESHKAESRAPAEKRVTPAAPERSTADRDGPVQAVTAPAPRAQRAAAASASADDLGVWNGPIPGFLQVSALSEAA